MKNNKESTIMITIDLTNDKTENHKLIKTAFLNSISPVFKLKLSKEFQETTKDCIEKVKKFYKLTSNLSDDSVNSSNDIESCKSCYLLCLPEASESRYAF